jgi:dihydroorotase
MSLAGGQLAPGCPADIVVFDRDREWIVDPATLHTKSPNTPLAGMALRGKPMMTIVGGEVKYSA